MLTDEQILDLKKQLNKTDMPDPAFSRDGSPLFAQYIYDDIENEDPRYSWLDEIANELKYNLVGIPRK